MAGLSRLLLMKRDLIIVFFASQNFLKTAFSSLKNHTNMLCFLWGICGEVEEAEPLRQATQVQETRF